MRANSDAAANKLVIQFSKKHKETNREVNTGASSILSEEQMTPQRQLQRMHSLRSMLENITQQCKQLREALVALETERQGQAQVGCIMGSR